MPRRSKKRGDKFRSKSERHVRDFLEDLNIPIRYEDTKIKYTWVEDKTYTPDFVLPNGIILEVKGWFTLDDRKKHLFIKEQHPSFDIRFIFDNPGSKCYKKGKMTYAIWCEKNEFKYCKRADGIPVSWLMEDRLWDDQEWKHVGS
jgi:hypothetical protein